MPNQKECLPRGKPSTKSKGNPSHSFSRESGIGSARDLKDLRNLIKRGRLPDVPHLYTNWSEDFNHPDQYL